MAETNTVASISNGSDDQKQLANDIKDIVVENGESSETTAVTFVETFDKAMEFYQESKQLLKDNNLEDAIEAGFQAINTGEPLVDTNDIRLADFYMQYGKCLLRKMQQSKGILDPEDDNADGNTNDTNNDEHNNTTESADNQDNSNDDKPTDATTTSQTDSKVDDSLKSTNSTTDETNESNNTSNKSNGKAEIDDEDDALEQDIDVADTEMANNTNAQTDENNDNNAVEEAAGEGETEEDSLRATCWEMLDTARFIIEKYLETEFNINVKELIQGGADDDEDGNEEDIDIAGVADVIAQPKSVDTDTTNAVVESNNDKEKETVTNETSSNEKDKESNEPNIESKAEEEVTNDDNDDGKYDLRVKYLLLLAESHMLCGEHQLEDNEFEGGLESFEIAIKLKDYCDDTQRELAYCHFYAAMAASHAQFLDIMEEHCNEAKDLLNDKILNIIDSFDNKKYIEKTQDENLDEEGLMELVNEFTTEYKSLTTLNEDEKKSVNEIGELVEFLKDINKKMDTDLVEYSELKKIEEEQGQSIRDLVMQVMLKQNGMDENDGNNNNSNNNNGNNNNNNNGNTTSLNGMKDDSMTNMTSVGGIEFGNKGGSENESDIVNTLAIKSKTSRKRTFDQSGIGGTSDEPLAKKQKVVSKGVEDTMDTNTLSETNDSTKKVAAMIIESKEPEQIAKV